MVTLSSLMKSCSLTTISTEGINNSLPHLSYPLREECEPVTAHPTLRSTNSVSYLTSKSPTGAWGGKKRNQLRSMEGVFFYLVSSRIVLGGPVFRKHAIQFPFALYF